MTSLAFHVDRLRPPELGGAGPYIRRLVPALAREDPSLEVRLFHARPATRGPLDPLLHQHWTVELRQPGRVLFPRWNLLARPRLPRPLSSLDVVHAPSPRAVPPAEDQQTLVVSVHDLAFLVVPFAFSSSWRSRLRMGLRAAVKRADAIVTPSRDTAEDLLTRTKIDPGRVHVIPIAPALDVTAIELDPEEAISRLKLPTPYILSVGPLDPRRNLVRLIRAYRRAAATGIPHALVLAGPLGWRHQTLLREIALPGPGDVVLTGAMSNRDLDAVYRRASALTHPALYDGAGFSVLEAMVRGIPVICSNTSSLPELVADAAVLVNPMSVREIASAIETVVDDAGLRQRLAGRGRARAERFSWDETARLLLQVYEQAKGNKG